MGSPVAATGGIRFVTGRGSDGRRVRPGWRDVMFTWRDELEGAVEVRVAGDPDATVELDAAGSVADAAAAWLVDGVATPVDGDRVAA